MELVNGFNSSTFRGKGQAASNIKFWSSVRTEVQRYLKSQDLQVIRVGLEAKHESGKCLGSSEECGFPGPSVPHQEQAKPQAA